jgi:rhodanese-related sulfurtransferase
MNKAYIFLALVLIALGLGLFILEANEPSEDLSAQQLLTDLNENTRYISTDELASRIIEGDPSIQLIDVRDPYDFMDFALPGAENLPITDLLTEVANDVFDMGGKDFIFYSNGDVEANKAWLIAQGVGKKRLYILEGGLNKWIETIIKPTRPAETESQDAIDLYQFRLGASQYFTGGSVSVSSDVPAEGVTFQRKKKKNVVEGGC